LQFSAPWGPHAIGFKVVHLLDSSRSWGDGHDPLTGVPVTAMPERPLQVLVWYPPVLPASRWFTPTTWRCSRAKTAL
jgi:hypothetical protein